MNRSIFSLYDRVRSILSSRAMLVLGVALAWLLVAVALGQFIVYAP